MHTCLMGTIPALPGNQPHPHTAPLLGKEGFQGCQQATRPQAIGESSAPVNGSRGQTKELAHRVAQLLHAVNHFSMFLVSQNRNHISLENCRKGSLNMGRFGGGEKELQALFLGFPSQGYQEHRPQLSSSFRVCSKERQSWSI